MSKDKNWHEFLAGGGSAFVNILFTFPAYKLMIRQQIDGVSIIHGFNQLKKEGLLKLYRGVGPPLIQKGTSLSIMFGSYYSMQKHILEKYPTSNPFMVKLFSGLMAGTFESILTPLERVQTLLAISDHKHYVRVENTLHAFLKIQKHYTFKEYYRGFTAILMRNGPSTAMFFLLRDPLKASLPIPKYEFQEILADFVSGAVLGATISTLFYPLNVIKSNMQKKLGKEHQSIVQTFKEVYRLRGRSLRQIYLGVSLNYSRALLSWGIINSSYEFFMKLLTKYDS